MALKCNFEHIGTTIAGLDRFDRKWDLLYLERTYRRPGLPVGGGFVKPRLVTCLCVLPFSAGVRKLLAYDFRSMLMPVDEFLPATYGQHLRKELAEAIYSEFMRVCARDRLRGHAALWKRDRSQCLRGMNLAQGARRSVKKMFAAVDLTPRDIDLEKFWSLWTRAATC